MVISYLNPGYLEVLRERLVGTLEANAKCPSVDAWVLQREDGTVLSDKLGLWTCDLSEAKLFRSSGPETLGATLVHCYLAEGVLRRRLLGQIKAIETLLGKRSVYLEG